MNGHPYHPNQHYQPRRYEIPDTPQHNLATDAVQESHQLLAQYPYGSATPANHVARHLGNLSISAAPPSYIQPYASVPSNASYHQSRFPQYPEYSQEFAHLMNPQQSSYAASYVEKTREEVVYHLAGQGPMYANYQAPPQWPPIQSRHSTYQTTPFAQSVIQHTSPSASYPTPPPPGISASSSSLAGALGPAPPKPIRQVYQPKDSPAFFSNFLNQTPVQPPPRVATASHPQPVRYHQQPSTALYEPPPPSQQSRSAPIPLADIPLVDLGSPDPLEIAPPEPDHLKATPKKRKVEQYLESPKVKRVQVNDSVRPSMSPLQSRPQQQQSHQAQQQRHQPQQSQARSRHQYPSQSQQRQQPQYRQTPPRPQIDRKQSSFEIAVPSPSKHKKPHTPPAHGSNNHKPASFHSSSSSGSGFPSGSGSQPYVAVPPHPKAYHTPKSQKKERLEVVITTTSLSTKGKGRVKSADDDDDLGGFGSEDDSTSLSFSRSSAGVKSSAKRATGDRDERAPIEKLATLLEDIFEAEDGLPPDIEIEDLPLEWFSPLSVPGAPPLLHPNLVRKLVTHITKAARPSKRHRLNSRDANGHAQGTPKFRGRVADIDTATLSRILKMLERSISAGEDLDPFPSVAGSGASSTKTAKTKKAANGKKAQGETRRSKSQSPGEAGDGDAMEVDGPSSEQQVVTEQDVENLTRTLELARDSVLAADCCIALLGSDRLPKQLYSEELITASLTTVKNHLVKILYPFVEASPADVQLPGLLRELIQLSASPSSMLRQLLTEIFQAVSSILPRINDLICADTMAMSESIIIQGVYIAIGPFFVVEAEGEGRSKKGSSANGVISALGQTAMRALRLDALALIRSIFANHEDQRPWIIEEILSSLIKLSDTKQRAGQFRLRDGRSIRTVSALLMQLVQTSAHDVRVEAQAIRKAREQALALRRQESFNEKPQKEPWLDEHDKEEIRLYASGLDSATKAAKTIIIFLTQRSGKTKTTKNSNEAEYRAIFDNLISDLLAVLFWPEWPAASLILGLICKFMVSSLDDIKSTSQNDNNAVKTLALDHLGVIAAHLRTSMLKFKRDSGELGLTPLDEVMSSLDGEKLRQLVAAHSDLQNNLCRRSSEDQAFYSARELTAVMWGHELALTLQHCERLLSEDADIDRKAVKSLARQEKGAMREIWDEPSGDIFELGTSQEELARIDRLSEEIGICQSLRNSFNPILAVVLQALDAPPVFMRTKALKALGQIVTSDPSILSAPNVRRGIEDHLLDSSPAVRDAAVELIGKYIVDSPRFAADYYQKIADRIADTGLGVRKRVIKLLKAYYSVTEDRSARIDICTRIVLRMLDEDDTVKDLAVKNMEELWFTNAVLAVKSTQDGKMELLTKVAIIMGVAAQFKDKQSPLEDLLHRIMADKPEHDRSALHQRYVEVCETLIDGLVDASDLPGFTILNCVQTIYLFTSAYPAVLSGSNAATLLPYLKNAGTPEEQATSDYLLRIFRASIPHMPKTAAKFGQELQLALQPMILKPSAAAGVLGLQETVACICATVHYLTHDFSRLVALLRSCNARLQQSIQKPAAQTLAPPEQRTLTVLLFITSLLCEHCNFDRLRSEEEKYKEDIDKIAKGSVTEHVYMCLLKLYDKYQDQGLRGRILQCLGFLFRAQPALMTAEPSAKIMDAIFSSSSEEARGRLLKILQDFLVTEAAKHAANEKASASAKGKVVTGKVNMEELIGNTDGFADSGVSSVIVQRYLEPILDAALSQTAQIQSAAVDILTFTIKQGLVHPLQSFPVIVALETSPNHHLSARASALHAILHAKHTSLLNARYVNSARASFDYQKRLAAGAVKGYRLNPTPSALLHRWYTLAREKRATRQDFLRALVKVFDVELGKSSQDDIDFTRYMSENFASFEYKTQEEVLTVTKSLTSVLSTTGMQLVEILSPSHLITQLHGPDHLPQTPVAPVAPEMAMDVDTGTLQIAQSKPPHAVLPPARCHDMGILRSSVIVAMVMLLKAHLKTLYGLSEEKCAKFVVGKKSAVGDRPATRKHERPLSWEPLPFATAPVVTSEDARDQCARFLEIWSEDGVAAEPEDDMAP
ncbi:hypothetical protein DICSQDRAFT_170603 [Dichomitus squalens LYAD-421 SS1]|uniref:Sister chromatid cohesion protein n=1 Tax=Dichomitus squalens (strain LYAD-421) TaxID=732165 RepID=R7SY05_DICSQ|nr:uncharacterized protein DICSQDRAFT_170603 [Dichomitus squalens LYAD-421 SS1]EJF61054.1 hypothetical protein DICSQDRAFT_170603 [Dichomitus squalens LYAD-421 SS1]